MTTAAEAMPLAQYLESHGVAAAEAARLGAEGDAISRNRGLGLQESAHPAAQALVRESIPVSARETHAASAQAELQTHLADGVYQPPASPADYQFPPPRDGATDEDLATDSSIRAAFHSEGVPRFPAENMMASMVEGKHALSRLAPGQVDERVAATAASVKRMWGADYDRNIATLDGFLAEAARRNPGLGIDATVRLDNGRDVPVLALLDSLTVNSLLEFAKHRASRSNRS